MFFNNKIMGNSNSNSKNINNNNSNSKNIKKIYKFYDFDIDILLKKKEWFLDGDYLLNREKITYTSVFIPVKYKEKIIYVPSYAALDLRNDYESKEDYFNRKELREERIKKRRIRDIGLGELNYERYDLIEAGKPPKNYFHRIPRELLNLVIIE